MGSGDQASDNSHVFEASAFFRWDRGPHPLQSFQNVFLAYFMLLLCRRTSDVLLCRSGWWWWWGFRL